MVGEVTLADSEEALDRSLELIVYPDTTHSIVDSREDHHRVIVFHAINFLSELTRIYVGDFLIHVEEVAVALANHVDAKAVDSLREVEEYCKSGIIDTITLVTTLLGSTRRYVAGYEVAECRVTTLEIVVALVFRDITTLDLTSLEFLGVFDILGHPDAAVVTERLRHKSKLRLLVAVNGDTSRVDLNVSGVCEESTLAIASHSSRYVATHCVGRKEVCVAVAAGSDYDCVSCETLELAYVAIGARSVEVQQHRLTVSGFDVAAGMKNPTSGDLSVMLNSVYAAQHPHSFTYRGWEVKTSGNDLTHTILRGAVNKHGNNIPNYHYEDLNLLLEMYGKMDLKHPGCVIDANHSNSGKQFEQQIRIVKEVMHSRKLNHDIYNLVKGVMIESYIEEGCQKIGDGVYGRSITDPCLGWEASEKLIYDIAEYE